MLTILIIFIIQCVFAVVVIVVLKKLLDKELMNSAIEKFESCKASSDVKEIIVSSASTVSDEFQRQLESIRKRKFIQAKFDFQEDAGLKGGVVIAIGDVLLDFSLRSRLKHFWS